MASRTRKKPTESLADQLTAAVTAGQEAWKALQKDESWEKWVLVGKAIDVGKRQTMLELHTNSPKGKVWSMVFGKWLEGTGFDKIDKSARSRLQSCIDQLPAIEKWRKTLPISNRLALNHPTTVLSRYLAANKPKKKDDQDTDQPKAKRATAVEVERLQRELSAAHAEIDRLQKEVAELERLRRDVAAGLSDIGQEMAAMIEDGDRQEMAAAQADQLQELTEPDAGIVPPEDGRITDPDLLAAMREANEANAAREAEIGALVDAAVTASQRPAPEPVDDPDLLTPENVPAKPGRQLRRRPSQRAIKAAIAAQAPLKGLGAKGSKRKSQ